MLLAYIHLDAWILYPFGLLEYNSTDENFPKESLVESLGEYPWWNYEWHESCDDIDEQDWSPQSITETLNVHEDVYVFDSVRK